MKSPILKIVKRVHEIFIEKGLTLSVAESCTGGLISSYLTDLPGASGFFVAGIVSYSVKTKKEILGVSPSTIKRYGVVSSETAKKMAEQIRKKAKTDYAVAVTGNLGPDVIEGKEKGLVYIAASWRGKTVTRELLLKGGRKKNKEEAAVSALKLLIELSEERIA
ncbi:MAG: CinA family protein [Nitrospirae bacterium]|nr:CinA family protein [Nitrospirota bacterium]